MNGAPELSLRPLNYCVCLTGARKLVGGGWLWLRSGLLRGSGRS